MIPVDPAVFAAMYVASLARAEFCDVQVSDGALELRARYAPSDALDRQFSRSRYHIVGCLGWAVPLLLDSRRRVIAASWIPTWGRTGATGAS